MDMLNPCEFSQFVFFYQRQEFTPATSCSRSTRGGVPLAVPSSKGQACGRIRDRPRYDIAFGYRSFIVFTDNVFNP